MARLAGLVPIQTATHDSVAGQNGQCQKGPSSAAQAHAPIGAVRSKPSHNSGSDLAILDRAYRGHVALLQVQRDHLGVPYQDGNALKKSVWILKFPK